jgi:hypothetical protein
VPTDIPEDAPEHPRAYWLTPLPLPEEPGDGEPLGMLEGERVEGAAELLLPELLGLSAAPLP